MSREVIESARIVLKTDGGDRIEVAGKGSAPAMMLTAFTCLSQKRREWMLKHMQAEHEKLLAKTVAADPSKEGGAA